MNFLESMQQRYTTKAYDAAYTLPQEQIEQLREILRLAPSSINSQPWRFTFIADPEMKQRLAEASLFNREKVERASHIVVFSVYSDIEAFERERVSALREYAQAYYYANIKPKGEEAVRSWLEHQVYIALGVLLSACATMGIDSTPMEGIDTAAYTELIGERQYRTLFAVALGRRDPEDPNRLELVAKSRRTDACR